MPAKHQQSEASQAERDQVQMAERQSIVLLGPGRIFGDRRWIHVVAQDRSVRHDENSDRTQARYFGVLVDELRVDQVRPFQIRSRLLAERRCQSSRPLNVVHSAVHQGHGSHLVALYVAAALVGDVRLDLTAQLWFILRPAKVLGKKMGSNMMGMP